MKTRNIILKILTILFLISLSYTLPAQPPPPGDHGSSGNEAPSGGGAPIGSGIVILLALGAGYGAKKYITSKKKQPELID